MHIANGDVHTNFGWLKPSEIQKGIEWGAISWGYKDHGILSVRLDKGSRTTENLSCWLAYIEREHGEQLWFRHLERRDELADVSIKGKFKALTGISVPLAGEPLWSAPHEDSQDQLKISQQTL